MTFNIYAPQIFRDLVNFGPDSGKLLFSGKRLHLIILIPMGFKDMIKVKEWLNCFFLKIDGLNEKRNLKAKSNSSLFMKLIAVPLSLLWEIEIWT